LLGTAPFLENRRGTEGVVERSRPPGAGVDGTRNEFPERVEILEYGTVWIVIMRARVMHVRGDPHSVGYAGVLYEGEDIGDLEFAPERRTVALCDGILADQADRLVRGYHLPGCARSHQLPLKPSRLRRSKDLTTRSRRAISSIPVRAPIASHIEQKNIEQ